MNGHTEEKFTEARIETTSGSYPQKDGEFKKLPSKEVIAQFVKEAVSALGITNTNGWVLTSGTTSVDPNQTWEHTGFAGQKIVLDYGPNHSGGGNA